MIDWIGNTYEFLFGIVKSVFLASKFIWDMVGYLVIAFLLFWGPIGIIGFSYEKVRYEDLTTQKKIFHIILIAAFSLVVLTLLSPFIALAILYVLAGINWVFSL